MSNPINTYVLLEKTEERYVVLGHATSIRTVQRELNKLRKSSENKNYLIEAQYEPTDDNEFFWVNEPWT